jgi:hypothetical protein
MLALRWVGNPLLLLALVLLMRRLEGTVVVHRLVPGRSTARRSCYNLPLLYVLVCVDRIVRDDDPPVLSAMRSCSLVERPIMKRYFFLSSVST